MKSSSAVLQSNVFPLAVGPLDHGLVRRLPELSAFIRNVAVATTSTR